MTGPVAERDLEAALIDRLQAILLELGHGFAFVARQYHFEVDDEDFSIDLLFFNWAQSRFVVVELEIGRFQPEHLGQLGFYVSRVDANLRVPGRHSPTVGILTCASRNDSTARYSLAGATAPMAVASYTYDALPDSIRELVPTDEQLGTVAAAALTATSTLSAGDGPSASRRSGGHGDPDRGHSPTLACRVRLVTARTRRA